MSYYNDGMGPDTSGYFARQKEETICRLNSKIQRAIAALTPFAGIALGDHTTISTKDYVLALEVYKELLSL